MTRTESIILLVSRLEAPDVAWDDVEELLTLFPGWLALVRALRYPVRPMDNRIVWGPAQSEFTQASDEDRLRLLEFFRPFSILLNAGLTPHQRAERLQEAGVNPAAFCKEHRHDAISEICESAASVLDVLTADRTLLRWHKMPQKPDQLVRQATEAPDESLLHPGDDTDHTKPTRTHWLRRSNKR